MLNYIKWELKNYLNKKTLWFIIIAAVYFLVAIMPLDDGGFLAGLLVIAFSFILIISLCGSFFIGTRKVTNTFSSKTFLLESMIPQPVNKLLLAKYLLGIIINLMFSIIGIVGLAIIIIKGAGFDAFQEVLERFMDEITLTEFLRFSFTYILSTITFMSFVVFGFILAKVIKPSGKGSKLIGTIICIIIFYTFFYLIGEYAGSIENIELFLDILYIVLSSVLFFITSWLIQNKLEIYN